MFVFTSLKQIVLLPLTHSPPVFFPLPQTASPTNYALFFLFKPSYLSLHFASNLLHLALLSTLLVLFCIFVSFSCLALLVFIFFIYYFYFYFHLYYASYFSIQFYDCVFICVSHLCFIYFVHFVFVSGNVLTSLLSLHSMA